MGIICLEYFWGHWNGQTAYFLKLFGWKRGIYCSCDCVCVVHSHTGMYGIQKPTDRCNLKISAFDFPFHVIVTPI